MNRQLLSPAIFPHVVLGFPLEGTGLLTASAFHVRGTSRWRALPPEALPQVGGAPQYLSLSGKGLNIIPASLSLK